MTDLSKSYKSVSTIKLTLIVVTTVSILFPVLFAYINDEMNRQVLSRELVVTPLRLAGISLIIHGIIQVINKIETRLKFKFFRYLVELPIIWFFSYWWLRLFHQLVVDPVYFDSHFSIDSWEFRQHLGLYFIGTAFIYIFQSGLNFYSLAQQKAAEAEQMQREYAQVRLQALKNQVNPHFLFNSLSALSSLVHVSAETSDKFIQQLAKAYRYILDQKDIGWVTLKSELDFLDAYFFLLQIRFEKKVKLEVDIDLDKNEYTLPPLTLQLLVENAVKHNKMSANDPLTIRLFNRYGYLVVENNISKREQHETSTGIGLENIKNRYAMVTDKKIDIRNDGKTFTATIPLLKT